MYRVFPIVALCAILFSCSKKDAATNENPCDQELTNCNSLYVPIDTGMNGFFFLPGSYWVYRNDSLGALDSVVLSGKVSGCEVNAWPQNQCYKTDYYQMNFTSYRSKTTWYDIIEGADMMRNWHPHYYDWWKGWEIYWLTPGHIDSMQVNNHTFYQISKTTSLSRINIPDGITLYTAKDIGIIRKVTANNPPQTWDLLRWKIYK